jgi:hypothetical protein
MLDAAAVRAAVESDIAAFGSPRDGQTARLSRRLEREVVPWTNEDFAFGRMGGFAALTNPDPVLAYLAKSDESEWRKMARDPIVWTATAKRKNRLLSFGSELTRPRRETPANKIIYDALLLNLQSIRKFSAVQSHMLDAVFWGFRPMEVCYAQKMFNGRRIWVQEFIRDKYPEDFAFNIDRELIWTGGNRLKGEVLLNKKADRFKWIVASSGSLDNPYGVAGYGPIWLPTFLKARFQELLASGVQRSIGIIRVTNTGQGGLSAKFQKQVTAPAAAKTANEIVAETRDAMKVLNEYGILGTVGGLAIDLVTDIEAVEAWLLPIEACDREIELGLTGQVLTSTPGDNGSRSAAETALEVIDTHCKADARNVLEPTINDDLLAAFLALNIGEVDPEDISKWRTKIGTQANLDAAEKMWRMGAPIDGSRVAQDAGVPLAEKDDGEPIVLQKSASSGVQDELPFDDAADKKEDSGEVKKGVVEKPRERRAKKPTT